MGQVSGIGRFLLVCPGDGPVGVFGNGPFPRFDGAARFDLLSLRFVKRVLTPSRQ